jgi:hypothetical protein
MVGRFDFADASEPRSVGSSPLLVCGLAGSLPDPVSWFSGTSVDVLGLVVSSVSKISLSSSLMDNDSSFSEILSLFDPLDDSLKPAGMDDIGLELPVPADVRGLPPVSVEGRGPSFTFFAYDE